jgi:O-antigen/teichoic acid export membrane protein
MTAREVVKGAVWSGLGRWSSALVSTIVFLVTARVLGPEPLGVAAMAWVVIALPQMLCVKVAVETLVQREDAAAGHADTAFWTSLLLSLATIGLTLAAGEAVAAQLAMPQLAAVLPWASAALLIEALRAVPTALLQRQLRFKAIAAGDALGLALASLTALLLALAGLGVWSLVAGSFVHAGVALAIVWPASRYRPSGGLSLSALRDLLPVSGHLALSSGLTLGATHAPRLAIGIAAGPEALGVFMLAWQTFDRLKELMMAPLNAVALAAVARMRADIESFRPFFERALSVSASLTYPVFLGVAVVAPAALPLLLGPQWTEAGPALALMMLVGLRTAVTGLNSAVLKGFGRVDLQTRVSAFNLLLAVLFSVAAAPFGPVAMAGAILLWRAFSWPLSAHYVAKVSGLAMAGACLGLGAIAPADAHPVLVIGAQVALGAILYPALLLAVSGREARRTALQAARRLAAGDLPGVRRVLMP